MTIYSCRTYIIKKFICKKRNSYRRDCWNNPNYLKYVVDHKSKILGGNGLNLLIHNIYKKLVCQKR